MDYMNTWLLASTLIGACTIVLAETFRVKKRISNETSRKVLHVAHGLVICAWAFTLSYSFIISAELLFIAVVLLARKLHIMQPLRRVNRTSWGDIFFPLGIIASLLVMPSRTVLLAAILHLTLADALAALVGIRAKRGVYYIFGQRKTLAGTGTFFAVSALIIAGVVFFNPKAYPWSALLFMPLLATMVENISAYGSDNLSIPLIVICGLSILS